MPLVEPRSPARKDGVVHLVMIGHGQGHGQGHGHNERPFERNMTIGNIPKALDWIDCFARCPVCRARLLNCGE